MKSIAFFNNKGGVGKTSLIYHLAWMYADLGRRVLLADLDPQSNLTAMCFNDETIERIYEAAERIRSTPRSNPSNKASATCACLIP